MTVTYSGLLYFLTTDLKGPSGAAKALHTMKLSINNIYKPNH